MRDAAAVGDIGLGDVRPYDQATIYVATVDDGGCFFGFARALLHENRGGDAIDRTGIPSASPWIVPLLETVPPPIRTNETYRLRR